MATLYFDAMRKQLISCGLTYANLLGYKKQQIKKPERKKGFRACYAFEWLHIDITNIPTEEDGIQKVAFVKDNYSSAILHCKSISKKADSAFMAGLLQETFQKHNLYNYNKDIHILSDGGSENKGEVLTWVKNIKTPPVVKKITALTDEFPFSNAMSESTHRIYKSEFMCGRISKNQIAHIESLYSFVEYYNYSRFPCRLYGKTPMEIVLGQSIDKFLFTETLQQAKANRVIANRNFNQCTAKIGCTNKK